VKVLQQSQQQQLCETREGRQMTCIEALKDAMNEALTMNRELFIIEGFECRVEYWSQLVAATSYAEKHNSRVIRKQYNAITSRYEYVWLSHGEKHVMYVVR